MHPSPRRKPTHLGFVDRARLYFRTQEPTQVRYINQTQHQPSAGFDTKFLKRQMHEALKLWPCIM
jgi:hypothetical protein